MQTALPSNSQGLVSTVGPSELENSECYFDILPVEVRQAIFSFANEDIKTLIRMSSVCTDWRELNLDPRVISQLFAEALPKAVNVYRESVKQNDLLYALALHARISSENSKPIQSKWEPKKEDLEDEKSEGIEKEAVIALVHWGGNLFSGTTSGCLRIWDAKTGELSTEMMMNKLLKDHHSESQGIVALKIIGDQLWIGLEQGNTIIWDLEKRHKNIFNLSQNEPIIQVAVFDNKTILNSKDIGIQVIENIGREAPILTFGQASVGLFHLEGETIITADNQGEVHFWNMKGEELKKFITNSSGITYLTAEKGKLITGANEGLIQIWDMETGKEIAKLEKHKSAVSGVKVLDGKIISSSNDGTICFWDFKGNLLKGFQCSSPIMSLDFYDNRLFAGYANGTIKVIDFNL